MQVNVHEAKTKLSQLLERVEAGEEVVIARAGRPVARLVRIATVKPTRTLGRFRGQIWIAPDFDELPPDVLAAFEGEEPARAAPVARSPRKRAVKTRKTR